MAIRIVRNESGNCINFYGSSNPTYWNACLSGEVDSELPDTINIINDIITSQTGVTEYEFYRIPYTEFTDAEGNSFASAQETADYITEKANVIGLSGEGISLVGETVCFSLDATSTSIMLDNGYAFGVNTIKAIEVGGLINIVSNDGSDDITHFYELDPTNTCVNGTPVSGGLNDVINILNELFTVGAFESVVISDPYSTMVADVDGVDIVSPTYVGNAIDPVGADVFGSSASGALNGYLSTETIEQAGEYFTFDIRVEGIIGFGLVHSQASYDAGYYSGNATYANPATFGTSNSSHYGFQFSHWFHPTPNGSWTNYGANTSYSQREGWSNFNGTSEQADWLAGNPIKVRVGLDANGFISIDTLRNGTDWVPHVRTSYPSVAGVEYRLGIKMGDTNVRLNTLPKVHHIAVDVTPPTTLGDQSITVFEDNAGDITGTLASGIQFAGTDDTFDNDGFVTTETISDIGDYFQFEWAGGLGDANIGLFSHQDHNVADLQADRTDWGNDDYIYFGGRAESNGELNNVYYENGTHATLANAGGDGYGRVGFDEQGRATLWYSSDGVAWTKYKRLNQSAPTGTYSFIFIAQGGGELSGLTKGTMTFAPTMYFRYIESPDGYYSYPLFATQEEADYYELITSGVDNGSHTHVYPDDPSNTTWYMPNTAHQMDYGLTPIEDGVTTFEGNTINWTEITSLTNADLVPPAYEDTTITVNELQSVNIQTQPQDTAYTTTMTGIPFGLIDLGDGTITGTAPEVANDNVANPSDSYTVNVVRTNSYGSSTGTLTIVVNNLTAPIVTAITGFTHDASSTALVDDDTLASGSVVTMDEDLKDLERLVILKSFVHTNILPSLQQAGDKYYMGVLNSGADVSSVEDADYDFAFVWEYQTSNSHKYRVIKDGVEVHNLIIGSMTNALYDYAIETNNGSAWMIACNQDAINTEPSPEYGGVFSNATEVAIGETLPLGISIAYVGSSTATFEENGLSEIVTPTPNNWVQVTANPSHTLLFDGGAMPTLQAGYTYRFLMGDTKYSDLSTSTGLHSDDILRFTADGSTEYTTGITRVGTINATDTFGAHTAYVEFVVPTDVPPLQWYTEHNGIGSTNGITISGSTYVATIAGINLEGLAANQTGTNIADNGDYGWMSIDESLSAGERFVMNNAFFEDLLAEMGDQYEIRIGLKGTNWVNTATSTETNSVISGDIFRGDIQLRIYKSSSNNIYLQLFRVGETGNQMLVNTIALHNDCCGFIEVDSTGDSIRMAFGRNGNLGVTVGSEATTTYADWNAYKMEAYNPNFNITSLDVMFLVTDIFNQNGDSYDGANVDWTELTEINIPAPAATNLTTWTKALDFSGSNEYAVGVSNSYYANPVNMGGLGVQVSPNADLTQTSTSTNARPWATAIVFKPEGNNSNQHIWNAGEGASTNNDNIYLRQSAGGGLYFGWGREGVGYNECKIGDGFSDVSGTSTWWGVYIAHKGQRFGASTATAQNLADSFDIRIMKYTSGSWSIITGGYANGVGNRSTVNNWNTGGTGVRMDRGFTGTFIIGGRLNNRSWHGKVASMVVTALRVGQPIPNDNEIKLMITDPKKWLEDYRVGQTVRNAHSYTNSSWGGSGVLSSGYGNTQIYLMGDGTADSYANGIRNEVAPNDQNYTKLQLNSMVSNDIQNVNIAGLS